LRLEVDYNRPNSSWYIFFYLKLFILFSSIYEKEALGGISDLGILKTPTNVFFFGRGKKPMNG
jgi:hypothetical protein